MLFYQELLNWIVEQMNYQTTVDKWENISELLESSDYPTSMWIAMGAGEYTDWGMKNFIQPKDETLVIVYDERVLPNGLDEDTVKDLFTDKIDNDKGFISLHQTFIAPSLCDTESLLRQTSK